MRTWRGGTSFTLRHPWAAAFAFGILHGFGFASGLAGLAAARGDPLALLLFNVGVELGQLAFVALALALVRAWQVLGALARSRRCACPATSVGTAGAFWTIATVTAMVSR